MTNLTGQSLGRYHILERLGEGGMATVYKAYDTRLERDVAVKIIRRGAFPPEQLEHILKRFEREAKALAKLNHPNIISIIDYGNHEGAPYLVMPYFPGGTLKQRLGTPIPWQEAVHLLLPIARALEYAHQQGIIHRDVKPSNILITEAGEPMLTDFGIAKILESEETQTLTGTGVGVGTPEYMAPEQWIGKATAQSDLYSLGVVFYEMVTGRKPYVADTPAAILLKQATEPLPRPQRFVPNLPESVESMLLKALAKDLQNRYPTMEAFAAGLTRLVTEGSNSIPPSPTSTTPNETDTQATIFQQADAEDTRDQGPTSTLAEALPSHLSLPRGLSQKDTKERRMRWLLPTAIGALALFFLCLIIGGLALTITRGPLTQNRPAATGLPAGAAQNSQPVANEPPAGAPQNIHETATEPSDNAATPAEGPIPSATVPTPLLSPSPTSILLEPEGKIVYTCQISRLADYNEVCLMNADGSHFRQLTNYGANSAYASLSPDGQNVVFSSNVSGSWQIYEMNLGSGAIWQLTFGPGDANAPDISPDGNHIVFKYSDPSGLDSIWVMNRDGSGAHQVYSAGWDPVWSPDGSQILFASGSLQSPQLYIINANGSAARQVTNMDNIRGRSDWSALGLLATYAGTRPNRNIYTLNPDGSGLSQITSRGDCLAPSFSPDGNWIAFTAYIDYPGDPNGCEIYVMRTDGSNIRRLTNNNYCDWQPRWGP